MIIIRIRIRSHCLQPKVPFFPTCNVAGYIFHGEEVELTVGEAGLAAEVLGVLAGLDQKGLQDQLLEQEELPDGLVLQQARPPRLLRPVQLRGKGNEEIQLWFRGGVCPELGAVNTNITITIPVYSRFQNSNFLNKKKLKIIFWIQFFSFFSCFLF